MFYLIFNFPSVSQPVEPEVENVLHVAIKILYEFQDKHGRDIEQRTYFKLRIDKVIKRLISITSKHFSETTSSQN